MKRFINWKIKMEKSVLVYSSLCPHCEKIVNLLEKYNALDKVGHLCIDVDPETNQRPDSFYHLQEMLNDTPITRVPSIVTQEGEVFTDVDAFQYVLTINNESGNGNDNVNVGNMQQQQGESFSPLSTSIHGNSSNFSQIGSSFSSPQSQESTQNVQDRGMSTRSNKSEVAARYEEAMKARSLK